MNDPRSPSQTVGPFFGFALPWPDGPHAVTAGQPGAIRVHGRLLDGRGDPVLDGLIETWQTPARTAEAAATLAPVRGFARCATDREGRYAVVTLKPSAIAVDGGVVHAPHLLVSIFARGLIRRLVTRVYFPDEGAANARDPVLAGIADPEARASLLAALDAGPSGAGYRFDIRLQGPGETAFFDV